MSEKPSLDLTGTVVLITGATRGIGREAAMRMSHAGALVAINYRQSDSAAHAMVRELGDARTFAVSADISNPVETEAMIDAVERRFGRLDVLVNNAAIFERNEFD